MKKIFALLLSVALLSISAEAHCGSCGTEKDHDHVTKTSVINNIGSIIETAKEAGNFSTLLTAVEVAGLSGALSGEGSFTVFAPTDEAFAALPEGTLAALIKDTEKLSSILTYHVLEGAIKAEDVVGIDKAETLNGQSVSVKVEDKVVMIDKAKVIMTDIICSNGIIHVIDAVILPNMDKQ